MNEIQNKQELYKLLQIPESKIEIENRQVKMFMGFPFFLRKEVNGVVEVITMHEYPKGCYSTNAKFSQAKYINLSPEIVDSYLKHGYMWFHESDMETTW